MATIRIPSGSSALTMNSLIALSHVDDRIVFSGEYVLDETLHFLPDRRYYGKGSRFTITHTGHGIEIDTSVPNPRRAWYKRLWRWTWVHVLRQREIDTLIKSISVFHEQAVTMMPDGTIVTNGNQAAFHFPMQ